MTWQARTKDDLMIEVWEKLDCESVGAAEIEAIGVVIGDEFGSSAVDSPMTIARLLADEGAELRHSEIMELHLARGAERPYDAALRNIVDISSLSAAQASIRNLHNLSKNYQVQGDKDGLRLVRKTALEAKSKALGSPPDASNGPHARAINAEIAAWFTIWLQTPEIFDTWLELRKNSPDFIATFGSVSGN